MDAMLLSMEEDTQNANQVKDLILERLLIDKLITDETASEYAEKWQVIIIKTSWFTRWCKKFNQKNNSFKYRYVKFEE